jgi:hypothetical protein
MNRLRLIIILFLTFFMVTTTEAQRWKSKRYEAYFGLGTAQHYGDIGGAITKDNAYGLKDIQLRFTRPSMSFGARFKLTGAMAAKLNFGIGFIAGNDLKSKNDATRGYSFRSTLFESSLQYEYYILPEGRGSSSSALFNRKGMVNDFFDINLYLFAGIGGVFSKSTVFDANGNPFTRDIYSKFKGDKYPRTGLVFPIGIGAKYIWDNSWSFGAEFGRRITTSDYLDGYSSIYSDHNDIYDFLTFSAIYKIPSNRRGLPILGIKARFRK